MRLALLLALLPAPALAEVAAEDVWAATEAYWEVWGVDVTGAPERDGATLAVRGIAARGALPFGSGELRAQAPDLLLTERGDGTVAVETANPAVTQLALTLRLGGEEITATLPVSLAWDGREMVASGDPGAVTFALDSGRIDLQAGPITLAGAPDTPDRPGPQVAFAARAGLASAEMETTVRPAAGPEGLAEIETAYRYGEMVSDVTVGMEGVQELRGAFRSDPSEGRGRFLLPARGVPLLQAAAALRAGARVEIEQTNGATESLTVSTGPFGSGTEDWSRTAGGSLALQLGAEGLAASGETRGLETRSSHAAPSSGPPAGPGPALDYAAATARYALALPLLAGDGQRIALDLAAEGLTLGADAWARLDPAGALPREPGTLALSVEQALDLPFDPVAPLGWGVFGARVAGGEFPVDLGPLSATLEATGAGARLSGSAVLDFDEGDLATLEGFPLAQGGVTARIEGHEPVVAALERSGTIPSVEAESLRAAVARAFRPSGPGAVEMVLDLGPGPSMRLNGRPID